MIGIVIVAHGNLAAEMLATVEHVLGRQENMRAVSVRPTDDRAEKQAEIWSLVDSVDRGQGVIVATDVFGGSPSNLSLAACAAQDRHILYGVNMPMLLTLTKQRSQPMLEALRAACEAGQRYTGYK